MLGFFYGFLSCLVFSLLARGDFVVRGDTNRMLFLCLSLCSVFLSLLVDEIFLGVNTPSSPVCSRTVLLYPLCHPPFRIRSTSKPIAPSAIGYHLSISRGLLLPFQQLTIISLFLEDCCYRYYCLLRSSHLLSSGQEL